MEDLDRDCCNVQDLTWENDQKPGTIWSSNPKLLPGLMVIDCFSRRVVAADPSCDYIALSYVWGSAKGEVETESFQRDLNGCRLPQTVQDAMNVVCVLGLRFLWVDRYCINAAETGTKHYMISNMDAVYEAAYMTIIAASGSDGEHGLPIVSRCFKAPDDGNSRPWDGLVDTEPSSERLKQIEKSAWSTRGWTYQEGVLSRRRLIFTDDLPILQIGGLRYKEEDPFWINSDIFDHINKYSQRKLKYPSDILKAFLGVFRAYERLREPAMHFWGVPFLLDSFGKIDDPGCGLLWRADCGCSLSRVKDLPSWTWAGRSGWCAHDPAQQISMSNLDQPGPYNCLVNGTRLWGPSQLRRFKDAFLEVLVVGQLIDISDYFRKYHSTPFGESPEPAPILHLTSWWTTLTASFWSHENHLGTRGPKIATFDENFYNREEQGDECYRREWTAAVIYWSFKPLREDNAIGPKNFLAQSLLLERVSEGTFRRVGILECDWEKSDLDQQGCNALLLGLNFHRTRLRIV